IYNVLSNRAGNYSVIASNSGGIAESTATLTVLQTNPAPFLVPLPPSSPTQFAFSLNGEAGRWYKIESASNLADWLNPGAVLYTNVLGPLFVPRFDPAHQFVRAAVNGAADLCGVRMKQWRVAMNLCAIERRLILGDVVSSRQFMQYFPDGIEPSCPD